MTSESEGPQGSPRPAQSSCGKCGNGGTEGELSALSIRPLRVSPQSGPPVLQYHPWARKGGSYPSCPSVAQSPSLPPAGRTKGQGLPLPVGTRPTPERSSWSLCSPAGGMRAAAALVGEHRMGNPETWIRGLSPPIAV